MKTVVAAVRWVGAAAAALVVVNLGYQQISAAADESGSGVSSVCPLAEDLVGRLVDDRQWAGIVRTALVAVQAAGLVTLVLPSRDSVPRSIAGSLVASTSSVVRA